MKKNVTGVLAILCAMTLSVAQPIEQNTQDNYQYVAPTEEMQQAAPTATESPVLTEPQTEPLNEQATTSKPAVQAEASQSSIAPQTQNDESKSIDNQPVIPQKKVSVSIGAKAAFIYGNLWGFEGLKNDDLEDPSGIGGEFGIAARFVMIEGLHFVPEISFRIFNVDHEDEGFTRYYNQMFLDFALYMRGFIGSSFFVEVAPQISLNTSSDVKINEDGGFKENIEQAPVEFGLNIGVGYFVHERFSVGFRWYMGFNEVFPDVKYYFDEDFDPDGKWSLINLKGAHTMMFKFGVTFWFI